MVVCVTQEYIDWALSYKSKASRLEDENDDLNATIADLQKNKKSQEDSLNAQIASIQDLVKELEAKRDSLYTKSESLEVENRDLSSELQALKLENSSLASKATVFSHVSWDRVKQSSAWYKDIDWSNIPFDELSDTEIENLNWSKINYKEAIVSEEFDYGLIDWEDIKSASKKLASKIYKDLDWSLVDFSQIDKTAIDWSKVDYKEAIVSEEFDYGLIDWEDIKSASKKLASKIYKDLDWSLVDFSQIDKTAIDWSKVDYKEAKLSETFTLNAIDWEGFDKYSLARQNKIHREIDWGFVDYFGLDYPALSSIHWDKVNYEQAASSSWFDYRALPWHEINFMAEKRKKVLYKKIEWDKVDYEFYVDPFYGDPYGPVDYVFDWSLVKIKDAVKSPWFSLDVVDIEAIKPGKNFNLLKSEINKPDSGDALLDKASSRVLRQIGYEAIISPVKESQKKSFSVEFSGEQREFSLIMRPLSYVRADAVAKAMGGSLATINGHDFQREFFDEITNVVSDKMVSRKLEQTKVSSSSPVAWTGGFYPGPSDAINFILDLGQLSEYNGENHQSILANEKAWFLVEL